MIRRFAYIVLLLLLAAHLSFAASHGYAQQKALSDTTAKKKQQQEEEKSNKVKEIAKAKRLAKPEKVDDKAATAKPKPARERRPEGMERPPEIPRRNGP